MRTKGVWIGFFILCSLVVYPQADSLKKSRYFNTFFSGALIGCGDCNSGKDFTLSFVTMHGIKFPTGIKLSAGAGLDVYSDWRLIPILIGFTIDKEQKPNGLFLHFNSGYSFGRYLNLNPYEQGELMQEGGFTINPMIGYRIGAEKIRLYVQIGYKYQHAYYRLDYANFGYPYSYSRESNLNRFVVQMGFGIN